MLTKPSLPRHGPVSVLQPAAGLAQGRLPNVVVRLAGSSDSHILDSQLNLGASKSILPTITWNLYLIRLFHDVASTQSAVLLMARVSPSPTAPPHPFVVSRKIYQRQSADTCGWVNGNICAVTVPLLREISVPSANTCSHTASPVTCAAGSTCASNTVNSVHFCCADPNDCVLPTACLDETALAGCGSDCSTNSYILKW